LTLDNIRPDWILKEAGAWIGFDIFKGRSKEMGK